MANNDPDFRTADELIRSWFQEEAKAFNAAHEDLMVDVGEWVLAAYLQGHEDGYNQGEDRGYNSGQEEGRQEGYDEGYDDAKAEFETDAW
jgi:flagellar biosynthesis/type III secretory pathway protein FliH